VVQLSLEKLIHENEQLCQSASILTTANAAVNIRQEATNSVEEHIQPVDTSIHCYMNNPCYGPEVYFFQWLKLNHLDLVTWTINVTSKFFQDLSKLLQCCDLENSPRKTRSLIGLKLCFYILNDYTFCSQPSELKIIFRLWLVTLRPKGMLAWSHFVSDQSNIEQNPQI